MEDSKFKQSLYIFLLLILFTSYFFSASISVFVLATHKDCALSKVVLKLYEEKDGKPDYARGAIKENTTNVPSDKKCSYQFTHVFRDLDEGKVYWVEGVAIDEIGQETLILKKRIAEAYAADTSLICPQEDLKIKVTREGFPLPNVEVKVTFRYFTEDVHMCYFVEENFLDDDLRSICYLSKSTYQQLCEDKAREMPGYYKWDGGKCLRTKIDIALEDVCKKSYQYNTWGVVQGSNCKYDSYKYRTLQEVCGKPEWANGFVEGDLCRFTRKTISFNDLCQGTQGSVLSGQCRYTRESIQLANLCQSPSVLSGNNCKFAKKSISLTDLCSTSSGQLHDSDRCKYLRSLFTDRLVDLCLQSTKTEQGITYEGNFFIFSTTIIKDCYYFRDVNVNSVCTNYASSQQNYVSGSAFYDASSGNCNYKVIVDELLSDTCKSYYIDQANVFPNHCVGSVSVRLLDPSWNNLWGSVACKFSNFKIKDQGKCLQTSALASTTNFFEICATGEGELSGINCNYNGIIYSSAEQLCNKIASDKFSGTAGVGWDSSSSVCRLPEIYKNGLYACGSRPSATLKFLGIIPYCEYRKTETITKSNLCANTKKSWEEVNLYNTGHPSGYCRYWLQPSYKVYFDYLCKSTTKSLPSFTYYNSSEKIDFTIPGGNSLAGVPVRLPIHSFYSGFSVPGNTSCQYYHPIYLTDLCTNSKYNDAGTWRNGEVVASNCVYYEPVALTTLCQNTQKSYGAEIRMNSYQAYSGIGVNLPGGGPVNGVYTGPNQNDYCQFYQYINLPPLCSMSFYNAPENPENIRNNYFPIYIEGARLTGNLTGPQSDTCYYYQRLPLGVVCQRFNGTRVGYNSYGTVLKAYYDNNRKWWFERPSSEQKPNEDVDMCRFIKWVYVPLENVCTGYRDKKVMTESGSGSNREVFYFPWNYYGSNSPLNPNADVANLSFKVKVTAFREHTFQLPNRVGKVVNINGRNMCQYDVSDRETSALGPEALVSLEELCEERGILTGQRTGNTLWRTYGGNCYYNGKYVYQTDRLISTQTTDSFGEIWVRGLSNIVKNLPYVNAPANSNWTEFVYRRIAVIITKFKHPIYGEKENREFAKTCYIKEGQCADGFVLEDNICKPTFGSCKPGEVWNNGKCEKATPLLSVSYDVYCIKDAPEDMSRLIKVRIYLGGEDKTNDPSISCRVIRGSETKNCVNGQIWPLGIGLYKLEVKAGNEKYEQEINTEQCSEIESFGNKPMLILWPSHNAFVSAAFITANATGIDEVDNDVKWVKIDDGSGNSKENVSSSINGETLLTAFLDMIFTSEGWHKINGFALDNGFNFVSNSSEFFVCNAPKPWKDLSLMYSLTCPGDKYTFTISNSQNNLPSKYWLIFNGIREEKTNPTFEKVIKDTGTYNIKVYACGWEPYDKDHYLYNCKDALAYCVKKTYNENCQPPAAGLEQVCNALSSCKDIENFEAQLQCVINFVNGHCTAENAVCNSLFACLRNLGIDTSGWVKPATGGKTGAVIEGEELDIWQKYGNWLLALLLLIILLALMWMFYERRKR